MYSKQFIKEIYKSMPEELADIIASDDTSRVCAAIVSSHKLSAEQGDSLDHEIMLLIMGLTSPDDFASSLEKNVGTDSETAKAIVTEISTQILSNIPVELLHAQEEYAQAKLKEVEGGPRNDNSATEKEILNLTPEILAKQVTLPAEPVDALPEIAPAILPETVVGETAHDVPHVEVEAAQAPAAPIETPPQPSAPAAPVVPPAPMDIPPAPRSIVEDKLSRVTSATATEPKPTAYPSGTDPYREPIE